MIAKLFLHLDDSSGVQLRVVNALKKLSLRTIKTVLKDAPNGGKLLATEVEGAVFDEGQVRAQLAVVEGVRAVLKVTQEVEEVPPEPTEDELRYRNKRSEAGDAEIRDRMLIFSLLSRYPNISNRLIELRDSIPEEDRSARLYELGYGFGRLLIGNLKVPQPISNLAVAIDQAVVPGIKPLANHQVIGNVVEVTGFNRNLDRGKPQALNCQFVHGTIEGLLSAVEGLPACHVLKRRCLHDDAETCRYEIVAD